MCVCEYVRCVRLHRVRVAATRKTHRIKDGVPRKFGNPKSVQIKGGSAREYDKTQW